MAHPRAAFGVTPSRGRYQSSVLSLSKGGPTVSLDWVTSPRRVLHG